MKKKIVILGSTGSIGKTTFNIIKKNPKDFNVLLLTTNTNVKEILNHVPSVKIKITHRSYPGTFKDLDYADILFLSSPVLYKRY